MRTEFGNLKIKISTILPAVFSTVILIASIMAAAEEKSTSPLDFVPETIAFNTPYGAPISLEEAVTIIERAEEESKSRKWAMNIAVFDSGANLVAFQRMDGSPYASIANAQRKARTAVKYRRPTKVFEDALQKPENKYLETIDDIIASRGGIPIIEAGKIIGGIGCSGGASSQDELICTQALKALSDFHKNSK